jgi:hypothetical protein
LSSGHSAREADIGIELQREAVLPGRVVELEEIAALGGARIVHQDFEPAECVLQRADRGLAALRRAQIGRADLDPPSAGVVDCGRGTLEVAGRARHDQDVAALLRQALGAGAPDALAAPRDQRGLAVQTQIHRCPPQYTPFAFIAASSASS